MYMYIYTYTLSDENENSKELATMQCLLDDEKFGAY